MATDLDTAREANRLYWETDTPVADIAEQLDISRRALYDAVEPLPAGAACEVCGEELSYENRSGRTSGTMVCLQCLAREEAAAAAAEQGAEAESTNGHEAAPADDDRFRAPALDARTARVGGAMLVGAALGAVATLLVVRR